VPRGTDRKALRSSLEAQGISVVEESRHSDYLKCRTDKKTFSQVFGVGLRWKSMRVGSWELKDDGNIPDYLKIKEIHLHRNILLPINFITRKVIKKTKS